VTRDELIRNLAEVLAGLQVPMSLGLPLGTAKAPWAAIHDETGFGWHAAEDYESYLTTVLEKN
jgi:hypothetical protein